MSNRLQKYWIPVTRALPTPGAQYLVTVQHIFDFGDHVATTRVIETAYYTDNLSSVDYDLPEKPGWYYHDSDYNYYDLEGRHDDVDTAKVVAWMPYPRPYEDEEGK